MEFRAAENLSEQITRVITERIIQNELKPGERIFESKIAGELGVSRSPIREALRILERNRLVELIPRKGAKVTEISASHIEWFYDVLEELFALVARKAVERAREEDFNNIGVCLKKIEKCAKQRDVIGYFNGIFDYAAIGMKAAGNPLLEQILSDMWPSTRRIQFASLSFRADELKTNVRFFQRATRYILAGDIEMADKVIREYARNEKAFALKIAKGR